MNFFFIFVRQKRYRRSHCNLIYWYHLFSSIVFATSSIKTHEIKFLLEFTGGAAGSLSLPSDVAVDREQVYVVDSGNHRLVVFNHQGQFRFAVGAEGDKPGQFSGPVGIDVAADGNVYIADAGTLGIIGRYWSVNVLHPQKPFDYYKNCFLLHLPADKRFLSDSAYLRQEDLSNISIIYERYLKSKTRGLSKKVKAYIKNLIK